MPTKFFILTLLVISSCSSLLAQNTSIIAAERARFSAQVAQDTEALEGLLHEDLYYLHSNGLAESKADFIASITSGKIVYLEMEPLEQQLRRYGRTALLTGLVKVVGTYKGKTFTLQLYYTSVYLKKRGQWQLVSWQSTSKED